MSTTIRLARALPALALALHLAGATGCATTDPAKEEARDSQARSHYQIALNHLREGETALAIRELNAAHELEPKDPWIELGLGEAYRLQARNPDSEQHLRRALELHPNFQAAKLNLAALYIQMERYDEAISLSQQLLADATFPVPWKALTNEGYAYYKLGRRPEARQALKQAIEYHDGFWPAQLDLAILDQDEGHHLEALEGFEKVVGAKPGPMAEAEAHYRMALVYISLGNRDEAVHHLTVATETRPSGEWGKRSEEYLKRLR